MDEMDFSGYQYAQLPCADCHKHHGLFTQDSEHVAVMKDENGYYFKCVGCGARSASTRDKKQITAVWNFKQSYRFHMREYRGEKIDEKVKRVLEVLA